MTRWSAFCQPPNSYTTSWDSTDRNYARYHQVLNRAVWSPRQAAGILLVLLLQHLDQGDGPLIFGIDETLYQSGNPGAASRP